MKNILLLFFSTFQTILNIALFSILYSFLNSLMYNFIESFEINRSSFSTNYILDVLSVFLYTILNFKLFVLVNLIIFLYNYACIKKMISYKIWISIIIFIITFSLFSYLFDSAFYNTEKSTNYFIINFLSILILAIFNPFISKKINNLVELS